MSGLKDLLLEFTDFINEPPQSEDQRMVREYRHEAYRKWEPVCTATLALVAERDALRKASEWHPFETAPQDGSDILATDNRVVDGFPQVVYFDEGLWHVNDAGISYGMGFFTHWMRVPALSPEHQREEG